MMVKVLEDELNSVQAVARACRPDIAFLCAT
jgi:hypothetical protein